MALNVGRVNALHQKRALTSLTGQQQGHPGVLTNRSQFGKVRPHRIKDGLIQFVGNPVQADRGRLSLEQSGAAIGKMGRPKTDRGLEFGQTEIIDLHQSDAIVQRQPLADPRKPVIGQACVPGLQPGLAAGQQ